MIHILIFLRAWIGVTRALIDGDQIVATEEKTKLENAQREAVKERDRTGIVWAPKYFDWDPAQNQWVYKWIKYI